MDTRINVRDGMRPDEVLSKIKLSDREKTGLSSVHRTHFLNELVKLILSEVAHVGHRLSKIGPGQYDKSKIGLDLENAVSKEADGFIGCDSVRSRV